MYRNDTPILLSRETWLSHRSTFRNAERPPINTTMRTFRRQVPASTSSNPTLILGTCWFKTLVGFGSLSRNRSDNTFLYRLRRWKISFSQRSYRYDCSIGLTFARLYCGCSEWNDSAYTIGRKLNENDSVCSVTLWYHRLLNKGSIRESITKSGLQRLSITARLEYLVRTRFGVGTTKGTRVAMGLSYHE